MEDFLKNLSINKKGKILDGQYTISLDNYDELSRIYNQLEQSELIIKDSDESYFNMDEVHVIYTSDEYELHLNGDLKDDVYVLTIQPIEE